MTESINAQLLLKRVKTEHGMTTTDMAVAFGFNKRTLKSWLLPQTSPGYRPMSIEAINLIMRSLLPKGSPFHFAGFVTGLSAGPKQAVMSRDGFVEFPRLYLLTIRDHELVCDGIEYALFKQNDNYYKCPVDGDHHCISFTGNPHAVFKADRYEVVESMPFTIMTPAIAKKLGTRYLYVHEVESAEAASGFNEAIFHASIWTADRDLADSFIACAFNGRYFIAYLATPPTWAKVKNYSYFTTLPHWNGDDTNSEQQWAECFDINGAKIDTSCELDAPPDANWIPVSAAEVSILRKTSKAKFLDATGDLFDTDDFNS